MTTPHRERPKQPLVSFARIRLAARNCIVTPFAIPLLLGGAGSAAAQLRLAPVIRDGMVMQRQATVPVWGWADQGDTVVVTFDRRTYTAVPNTSGHWVVKLPPRAAGGPYEMIVAGKRERFRVQDILVGDVWLAAGQSNMWLLVSRARNAAQEIAAARDSQIRQSKMTSYYDKDVVETGSKRLYENGAWLPADSAQVGKFSAVGYYFARELRKSVDVPIGLINVAVGGSAIAQWVSGDALRLLKVDTADLIARYAPGYLVGRRTPMQLYNQMVHPLLPYPIKGILWYQGESEAAYSAASNSYINLKYRDLFVGMITDWRRAWGLGDIPFLFVQLPSYGPPDTARTSWAILRESQSTALRLPNTAQVVTIDLGEADDIHPTNKQDVGVRLALAARKVAYGEKVEHSGPQYRRHTFRNGRAILEFDHIGQGLTVGRQGAGGEVQGFVIAGADRQFVRASAKIEGDRVVVWSEQVPNPVALRYAWHDNPHGANLYNQAGLPAAPFRTDE